MDATTMRLGSLVAISARTAKTTCPGWSWFKPSWRETSLQCGGKIELTRTRLNFSIPASRRAISKLVSFSLWRPTPRVRNPLVGTKRIGLFTVLWASGFVGVGAPFFSGARGCLPWGSLMMSDPSTGAFGALVPRREIQELGLAGLVGPAPHALHDARQEIGRRLGRLQHLQLRLAAVLSLDVQDVARAVDQESPLAGPAADTRSAVLPS